MKHAVIVKGVRDDEVFEEYELNEKDRIILIEKEYDQSELEEFEKEAFKWIVECKGSRYFMAGSDSGEDATGCYCKYFDLTKERAVFKNGKLAGFYLFGGGFRYSGNDRSSFDIDEWDYPGSDLFKGKHLAKEKHVFLFEKEETHVWNSWKLLRREENKEYKDSLEF